MQDQTDFLITSESDADDVSDGGAVCLSLTSLAREFGSSRETMRSLIDDSNIQPAKHKNTFALYRLKDVLIANRRYQSNDPNTMPPHQRLALAKAMSEELRLAEERKQLIRSEEIYVEWAQVIKVIIHHLENLPEECERDLGVSPAVTQKIEATINRIRQALADELINRECQAKPPLADGDTTFKPVTPDA